MAAILAWRATAPRSGNITVSLGDGQRVKAYYRGDLRPEWEPPDGLTLQVLRRMP